MSPVKSSQILRWESKDRTATRSSGVSRLSNRPPLLEHTQQPDRANGLQALLHHEDDQLATTSRLECADEVGRREGTAPGLLAADPVRGLDADLLAVNADVEIGRLQAEDRFPAVVDHPRVHHDAGHVHPLDTLRLLGG